MLGLLQRVTNGRVEVKSKAVGGIERGILVLVGVERGDDQAVADRLLERLLTYRVFTDEQRKMNLSVADIGGGLLLVPQFTLAADTNKGTRPSFSAAAAPKQAQVLFDYLAARARERHQPVATGEFGAHMMVSLTNDGPVTFLLRASAPQ